MDKQVEERFERIEKNLEESGEYLKDARLILDETLEHLKLTAQMLQDSGTLSRETRKTLDTLIARQSERVPV